MPTKVPWTCMLTPQAGLCCTSLVYIFVCVAQVCWCSPIAAFVAVLWILALAFLPIKAYNLSVFLRLLCTIALPNT